jgi:hypothetical protein
MKKIFVLIFVLSLFFKLNAQGEAAVPFISMSLSPKSMALGWTGVSLPLNDPLSVYTNPALLGYYGKEYNLSTAFISNNARWFPRFSSDMFVTSHGYSLGYNLSNLINKLEIGAGFAITNSKINYGTFVGMNNNIFESYDEYINYGFGASVKYFVTLSAGFNLKDVTSYLGDSPTNEDKRATAEFQALDWGVHLAVPFHELFQLVDDKNSMQPNANLFIGYTRSNIGDEIYYFDESQKDPIPLSARLGYTINLGVNYNFDPGLISLFDYNMILEANDILISRSQDGKLSYQGLLGDIKLQNFIWQGSDGIILHRSHQIKFFETVSILAGSFRGRGYHDQGKSKGILLSSRGLFKYLSLMSENELQRLFLNHFEIEFVSAQLFDGSDFSTKVESINISLKNVKF